MIENVVLSVCTNCAIQTKGKRSGASVAGFVDCYFCGAKVITGCLEAYQRMFFEPQDDAGLIVVTKIRNGLHFLKILDKEVYGAYRMFESEYDDIPSSMYEHLVEYGLIGE